MEAAMPDTTTRPPVADFVFGAIANWVNWYRSHSGGRNDLARCSPDEVKAMAKDLGLSPRELRAIAAKGPRAAELLLKLLGALGIDAAKLDPAILRDMQRLCSACESKGRCERELAHGSAAAHFHEFCPNALTLDALIERQALPFQR
jgi:hypothetical protein